MHLQEHQGCSAGVLARTMVSTVKLRDTQLDLKGIEGHIGAGELSV